MKNISNKQNTEVNLAILPISSMANSLNIHQRTLRIYDKEGILSPIRTDKNRRNYTIDDLEKAKLILFLTRNLALNLAGVRVVLAMLENMKIKPKQYLNYAEKIAKQAGIDVKTQEVNIEKTSKRGRKPKNAG